MRIHITSTAWHGNYHNFLAEAFKSLGHESVFFDEGGSKLDKFYRKVAVRLPRFQYAADDFLREKVSVRWVESVEKMNPDIVLLVDFTWNILPSTVEKMKNAGRRVVYWVTSPPTQGGGKDVLASIKFSGEVFTIDPQWMPPVLFENGDFTFLPLAGDPRMLRPLSGTEKEYDVAFVASFAPQSWDGFIRAYAISHIPEKYNVAIFGKGIDYWYKYFPILRKRAQSARIHSFSESNEIYGKSRIVLNLHSTSHTSSFSARTFEIALAGAFQIIDSVPLRHDSSRLFPGGVLQSFGSLKEMNRLIDYWLPREKEREEIAAKTREIVLANHTWQNRAKVILRPPEIGKSVA